jgi:hypothetical protein
MTGFALFPVTTWDGWVLWLERFEYREHGPIASGRPRRKEFKRYGTAGPPLPARPPGPPPPKK